MEDCIGEISFYSNRAHWKIPYFFDIPQEISTEYASPRFSFKKGDYTIFFRPNSAGWFGMRVCGSCGSNFSHGRIGIIGELEEDIINTHGVPNGNGFIRTRLIRHSTIVSNKDRMVPGGVLHLFMSIGENDSGVNPVTQVKAKDGLKKLSKDFKEILLNGNISDVVLKVKGQKFKAHRCVLAARSPVFLAMMTHETKEKISGLVEIPDVEPSIFSDFLDYLYTGNVENLTLENVGKLYAAADKYKVNDLKEICMDRMMMNISVDKFCDVLTLSFMHDVKVLKDACIRFFANNSLRIINTAKWQSFLSEYPIIGNELFIKHLQFSK